MKQKIQIACTTLSAFLLCAATVYAATWVDNGGQTYIQGTNVGVGTSSPDTRMHISNSSAEMLKFENTLPNGGMYQFKVGGGGWEDGKLMIVDRKNGLDASRITIAPSGNVGIGTNSPQNKVHVVSTDPVGMTLENPNGGADTRIEVRNPNAVTQLFTWQNLGARIGTRSSQGGAGDVFFTTDDNIQMTIKDTGRVGIGRTDPQARLHVLTAEDVAMIVENPNNAADSRIEVRNPNAVTQLFTWQNLGARIGTRSSPGGAGDVFFTTDDNIRMTIKDTGNVGIGSTNPNEKLTFSGNNNIGFKTEPGQNWGARMGYVDYLNSRHGMHIDGLHNGQWQNNQLVVRADSGNVGIGTFDPNEKLTLTGTANIGFRTESGQNFGSRIGYFDLLNMRHGFHVDGMNNGQWQNNQLVVRADSGNVGVGTVDPAEKLHVQGNIKLSGNIVSDGDICIGKCN